MAPRRRRRARRAAPAPWVVLDCMSCMLLQLYLSRREDIGRRRGPPTKHSSHQMKKMTAIATACILIIPASVSTTSNALKSSPAVRSCRPGVVHRRAPGAGRGTPPAAPPGRRRCAAVSDGFRHGTPGQASLLKLATIIQRDNNVLTFKT